MRKFYFFSVLLALFFLNAFWIRQNQKAKTDVHSEHTAIVEQSSIDKQHRLSASLSHLQNPSSPDSPQEASDSDFSLTRTPPSEEPQKRKPRIISKLTKNEIARAIDQTNALRIQQFRREGYDDERIARLLDQEEQLGLAIKEIRAQNKNGLIDRKQAIEDIQSLMDSHSEWVEDQFYKK